MAVAVVSLHTLFLVPSRPSSSFAAISTKPRAVLSQTNKKRSPYALKQGQSRLFHELPSGLNMEVIVQKQQDPDERKKTSSENPPLVFVHGSYHAAWCWAEHWLPFFSDSGYDCYAVSLLGQGESDAPAGSVAGTLETHAGDISDFINRNLKSPPVLLGHSFGGLIIQYYIASLKNDQLLGDTQLSSKSFSDFSSSFYQELMKESSRMPLFDLRKLNASLPVPSVPKSSIELLVLGAKDDFIVDMEGFKETGNFYGVSPVCIEGVAHDMMLDCSWERGSGSEMFLFALGVNFKLCVLLRVASC
ncbi:hypothetical protein TIFTF001_001912 [Ficus carica]|uniref:AB hydrolase-1 domain-containing protein n=1 Tax=Ficus carica TaxID=3494 RepID=A0AA88CSN3_FICCA|nr:hypothetical protein TIFTF001_001912 [Ficus carica]